MAILGDQTRTGTAILEVRGLRKSYRAKGRKRGSGPVEAVKGIDLTVEPGEIFGFLGPNGAGKSTTLRILATLLPPDAGSVRVAGHDLASEPLAVRRSIGYVSQAGGTDQSATGRENLLLQARLYGLDRSDAKRRSEELIETLGLGDFIDRLARTYSGGQRRKLDTALGMIHDPAVLFLDEPTTGLDPVSRAQLWNEIRKLRSRGTTVFITTHYLDEADALCDRIAIIDKGAITAHGTPLELKRQVSGDVVALSVNHVENALERARELLGARAYVRDARVSDNRLLLTVSRGEEALPDILRELEATGIGVVTIALSRPSLDDVFLRVTGHSLADAEREMNAGAARAAVK